MAIYVIMESAVKQGPDGLQEMTLVRDGFSLLGFVFPAFWLLWNRLWIEALLVFAVLIGLPILGDALGIGAAAGVALSLLVSLYVGLEGSALRLAALRRRGWRQWGVVKADSKVDAEIRYILEAVEEKRVPGDLASVRPRAVAGRSRAARPPLELFPYPGAR
jgi:hypothetical protein